MPYLWKQLKYVDNEGDAQFIPIIYVRDVRSVFIPVQSDLDRGSKGP